MRVNNRISLDALERDSFFDRKLFIFFVSASLARKCSGEEKKKRINFVILEMIKLILFYTAE